MIRFAKSKSIGRALVSFAFVLLFGGALHAQTITDPRRVEFSPSPDHNAVDSSGTPLVSSYTLLIYVSGASTPTQTVSLGKPAPESDGMIRVDFVSLLTTPLAPAVTYEGRVSANGPGGSSPSVMSNTFSFLPSCVPVVSPTGQSAGSAGGTFNATVTVAAGCGWSATSASQWITITAGPSGTDPGRSPTVSPRIHQPPRGTGH